MANRKALYEVVALLALISAFYYWRSQDSESPAPPLVPSTIQPNVVPTTNYTPPIETGSAPLPPSPITSSVKIEEPPPHPSERTGSHWAGKISPELSRLLYFTDQPDSERLAQAKEIGPHTGWQASGRTFPSGRYRGLFSKSHTDLSAAILFEVEMGYPDDDTRLNFAVRRLFYKMDAKNTQTFNYTNWVSPFDSNELYGSSLHVPFDDFWKKLAPDLNCAEVMVIETAWSIPENLLNTTSLNGRVFCRHALENLTPIGWISFCQGERC